MQTDLQEKIKGGRLVRAAKFDESNQRSEDDEGSVLRFKAFDGGRNGWL